MSTLPAVKIKNSFKKFQIENQLFICIIDKIKIYFPNHAQLKYSVELIEHILQLIENSIKNKLSIDKQALLLKIISSLFQYKSDELKIVENK